MPRVIITNVCTSEFEIPDGNREQQDAAIKAQLRSKDELTWTDDPEGVKALVINGNKVWRIRDRFKLGE